MSNWDFWLHWKLSKPITLWDQLFVFGIDRCSDFTGDQIYTDYLNKSGTSDVAAQIVNSDDKH
jgi:hypothetical protein